MLPRAWHSGAASPNAIIGCVNRVGGKVKKRTASIVKSGALPAAKRKTGARKPRDKEAPRNTERTRKSILMAAVDQFAEKGFRHTSIRDIARRANKNSALVRYYFGSKRRLYAEVIADSIQSITETALRALDAIEAKKGRQPPQIETIVRMYVAPFRIVAKNAKSGMPLHLRQLARFVSDPLDADLLAEVRAKIELVQRRFAQAIAQALPNVAPHCVWYRLAILIAITAYLPRYAGYFDEIARSHFAAPAEDDIWDHMVAASCDMFRGLARGGRMAGRTRLPRPDAPLDDCREG